MRVLVVSKALVHASYRRKLTDLARLGSDIVVAVPPEWREGGGVQRLERGETEGYRLVATPIRMNGHFHLHWYPHLRGLIREAGPDVLHMDEEPYNLATYLGVRAAASARIPSLFYSYQNLLRRYPPPFRAIEKSVFRHAHWALASSLDARDVLRAKGYSGDITVVPQVGIDPDAFSPAEPATGPFSIGFLNRLVPAKGAMLVLQAMQSLPSDARLLIVGEGPLRQRIEEEIACRGLGGRVTVQPRVPSSQVPDVLRRLHAVVLPSLTTPRWKEQFGRVLVESMACGIPVVGSSSGEIPHVVGDAGLIVPEGDAGALAHALQRLHDDTQLRQELRARGRERVLERFTNARVAEMTHAVYVKASGQA